VDGFKESERKNREVFKPRWWYGIESFDERTVAPPPVRRSA